MVLSNYCVACWYHFAFIIITMFTIIIVIAIQNKTRLIWLQCSSLVSWVVDFDYCSNLTSCYMCYSKVVLWCFLWKLNQIHQFTLLIQSNFFNQQKISLTKVELFIFKNVYIFSISIIVKVSSSTLIFNSLSAVVLAVIDGLNKKILMNCILFNTWVTLN